LERNIEREHVPLALELDIGITPWGPLASGMLTGKHKKGAASNVDGAGRLKTVENSPVHQRLFTDRNWQIVEVLRQVAAEVGAPMAQVALAIIARRPGVSSTIVGATNVPQLEENLRALELVLSPSHVARLEEAGRPPLVHPYNFFEPGAKGLATAGTTVRREPPWFRRPPIVG
jgi:aryl-alcohol dehydrogenase-like predicted oxidoreductase